MLKFYELFMDPLFDIYNFCYSIVDGDSGERCVGTNATCNVGEHIHHDTLHRGNRVLPALSGCTVERMQVSSRELEQIAAHALRRVAARKRSPR